MVSKEEEGTSSSEVWATCAVGQLVGAGLLYSRGHGAASMPFRAFCIASLLLTSGACATTAALHATGIHQIEDLKELGKSIRHSLDRSLGKGLNHDTPTLEGDQGVASSSSSIKS